MKMRARLAETKRLPAIFECPKQIGLVGLNAHNMARAALPIGIDKRTRNRLWHVSIVQLCWHGHAPQRLALIGHAPISRVACAHQRPSPHLNRTGDDGYPRRGAASIRSMQRDLAAALLEFLTRPAGTRIIPTNFGSAASMRSALSRDACSHTAVRGKVAIDCRRRRRNANDQLLASFSAQRLFVGTHFGVGVVLVRER